VQRRAWAPALLDWLGAPSSLLPPLVEAGEPTGHVVGAAPRQMSGAVITVAGHDHLCAAVGAGAIGFDDVLVSCGTAEAIIRPVPPPATGQLAERAVQAGLSLGWHAAPGRLALTGGFAGGQGLERILRLIDRLDPGERDALSRWALGLPETPDGLEVDCVNGVPSLSLGGHGCGPVEVWRAAIWSVVEGAHGVLARAEEVLGRPAKRIAMTGGWLQDPAVHALHRRLLDADRAVVPEAAARGAALLAGCAVGCFPGVDALPGPSEASFHGRPNDGRVARAEQQRVVLASGSHGDNVDSEGS
jgi:sugar (pentulose or hexulose) kinase